MTVLARLNNNWYLAGRSDKFADSAQFSMKAGLCMPGTEGFQKIGNSLSRTFESFAGITFYPELRYRGVMTLIPLAWSSSSEEPLLSCRGGRWLRKMTHEETEIANRAAMQDGWQGDHHHGLFKSVYIDEIEKIEGPPPDGAF